MNPWIALFLGIALGWIIEWAIDWFYTRNRVRKLQGELELLKQEKAGMEDKAVPPPLEEAQLVSDIQPIEVLETVSIPTEDRSSAEISVGEPEAVAVVAETESNPEGSVPGIAGAALAGALIATATEDNQESAEEQAEFLDAVKVVALTEDQGEVQADIQPEEQVEVLVADQADLTVEDQADLLEDQGEVQNETIESSWVPLEESFPQESKSIEPPPVPEPDLFTSKTLKQEVEYVEGIGPVYGARLKGIGITNGEQLLREGATPKGRAQIVSKTGIRQDLILTWVNHADLYRIKGIGSEYAELLEAAGVDTVIELATRVPQNLHEKITELNLQKKLVRQPPSLSMVQNWVEQAKTLPRVVVY
jgi:predicted flap endonuclease-1-like 5' DNA nuclease